MPSASLKPRSACDSGSPRSAAARSNVKATAGLNGTPSPIAIGTYNKDRQRLLQLPPQLDYLSNLHKAKPM
jgi:hypothetical protein